MPTCVDNAHLFKVAGWVRTGSVSTARSPATCSRGYLVPCMLGSLDQRGLQGLACESTVVLGLV
jgi:hypothetical protein